MFHRLTHNPIGFSAVAIVAAFGVYTCMYAFRRPFTVAQFDAAPVFGIDYKVALVSAQLIGYTLAKFLGISVIGRLAPQHRMAQLLAFMAAAGVSLALFAIVPPPWNILLLFANGIPLGLIWGIVFSYLEGRRSTELLGAGLCTTFVISSGLVKSAGAWIAAQPGVSPYSMPVLTALLFTPALLFFTLMLHRLPPPDVMDRSLRSERVPLPGHERRALWHHWWPALLPLVLVYAALTVFRDLRDNFAPELWRAFGYHSPGIFTTAEIPVALAVIAPLGILYRIQNNRMAFFTCIAIITTSIVLIAASSLLLKWRLVDGAAWMILSGMAVYAGYIPYNIMLFERLMAVFQIRANAGFFVYIADSVGYLGSVVVLLLKNFAAHTLPWQSFIMEFAVFLVLVCLPLLFFSVHYLLRRLPAETG